MEEFIKLKPFSAEQLQDPLMLKLISIVAKVNIKMKTTLEEISEASEEDRIKLIEPSIKLVSNFVSLFENGLAEKLEILEKENPNMTEEEILSMVEKELLSEVDSFKKMVEETLPMKRFD